MWFMLLWRNYLVEFKLIQDVLCLEKDMGKLKENNKENESELNDLVTVLNYCAGMHIK